MRVSHCYMRHKECSICGNEGCDVSSLFLGYILSVSGGG
jgi:hypothetical protein